MVVGWDGVMGWVRGWAGRVAAGSKQVVGGMAGLAGLLLPARRWQLHAWMLKRHTHIALNFRPVTPCSPPCSANHRCLHRPKLLAS